MPRHPSNPDCSVNGCTRAAYRLGLCRQHTRLVPASMGVQLAVDCIRAQYRLKQAAHRKAATIANRAVREARKTGAST